MITSITSTLIREGCSITSITSSIFGSNGSITSSLLQIVLHYYTITSITSSSLLHKHFHYFPLVGKVMGSNGSITSYYVPPQLGGVPFRLSCREGFSEGGRGDQLPSGAGLEGQTEECLTGEWLYSSPCTGSTPQPPHYWDQKLEASHRDGCLAWRP